MNLKDVCKHSQNSLDENHSSVKNSSNSKNCLRSNDRRVLLSIPRWKLSVTSTVAYRVTVEFCKISKVTSIFGQQIFFLVSKTAVIRKFNVFDKQAPPVDVGQHL